ncbi:MarR family winged helix-turn-helix transcriptional regulator [Hydrogeniiclostridium mannosilyticum]|uniref:MarR family winged helix-turn-helix transcriptional regulator n=1 Tax=Hydrogeniiclostridium mannosilyticum TaxID=2764322 RepID=UPI0018AB7744|nr:MarR family transcriptional regulator [Hydrogeniiclostridium mannosilyticum]
MKELNRPKNLKRFYLAWQRLNHVYEEYAKEHDLTYISMFVLQLIDDGTTQKEICDTLYFPKQTVNKVILSFEKKGYVTLVENPDDGRARSIMLTEKGRTFQEQVISHIEKAELETFASLTEPEQQIMTDLWEKYTATCISKIKGI